MPGFLNPGKGMPLLLIPEYSGINKGQRIPDKNGEGLPGKREGRLIDVSWVHLRELLMHLEAALNGVFSHGPSSLHTLGDFCPLHL